MKIFSLSNPTWLAVYLVLLVVEFTCLFDTRIWAIREFSSANSRENWQEWQAETARQAQGSGPVTRREASSAEPPTLVLLRDYFWMLMVTLWILSTVLFVALVATLQGAFSTKTVPLNDRDAWRPAD